MKHWISARVTKGRCLYGYVPLNIPPRAPSRTPRLNNIQIYIEIYCYSTTGTKGQCFWRCPAYIAVTFHLVSEAEKQDIKGGGGGGGGGEHKQQTNRQTKINKGNKYLSAGFSQEHTQMF